MLIDGRRPLLGGGIPRDGVGDVLRESTADVAVLVAARRRRGDAAARRNRLGPVRRRTDDWVALEIAAAICSATGAQLRLIGSRGHGPEDKDASGLLDNAAMLVRNFVGVDGEAVLAEPGREGILSAVEGSSLVFIGLSERWRQEGLGETRGAIARAAPAPIVFVRAGDREGDSSRPPTSPAWAGRGPRPPARRPRFARRTSRITASTPRCSAARRSPDSPQIPGGMACLSSCNRVARPGPRG